MAERSFVFRLGENVPAVVRAVLEERGWQEHVEGEDDSKRWNLWWKCGRFRQSEVDGCRPWQRLNHMPRTSEVTKKDNLCRNLKKMKAIHGLVYDFFPLTFILPNEYTKFVRHYSEHGGHVWICKPADLSRGRGIFLFRDVNELTYDGPCVVQHYIPNPLLIAGYKFDMRLYVVVTSYSPLTIYLYDEGLARFGTDRFDIYTLDNVYSHLTNTSINKNSPHYESQKGSVGPGCKWSLSYLRTFFAANNMKTHTMWQRVRDLITLTLLTLSEVPRTEHCFELFGFDVLLDQNLKPWLLEVNFSPALGTTCAIDWKVKKPAITAGACGKRA
eukprot:Colp12_sorted_trinity150504_noHs@31320